MPKKQDEERKSDRGVKRRHDAITPARKARSDSDTTASSDLAMGATTTGGLIVSVREVKTAASGKEIALLSILPDRLDTNLGAKQGDHVTAYRSFLEMLITAAEGSTIKRAPKYIARVASALLPEKATEFQSIINQSEDLIKTSTVSSAERHETLEQLKSQRYTEEKLNRFDKALKNARKYFFIKTVERLSQYFIEQVNLDEDTAFSREGIFDSSQGTKVKKAVYCLKAINDLSAMCREKHSAEELDTARIKVFCKRYIETNALFIMGANYGFSASRVTRLSRLAKAYKQDELKRGLFALYSELDITQKIGQCFGDLFDFRQQAHVDLATFNRLYKVVAKHLVVMFNAFEEFKHYDSTLKTEIIEYFLNKGVLEEQGWKNASILIKGRNIRLDLLSLNARIKEYANLDTFKMLSEADMPREKEEIVEVQESNSELLGTTAGRFVGLASTAEEGMTARIRVRARRNGGRSR